MADAATVQAMQALHSCRCCLRRPPDKGLKTLYENVGKTENYWDMLKECFNIHLNVGNDECGICEVCVARLRDATEFKMQVQQSQVELKALLEKALQEKDKKPNLIKEEFDEDPNVEEVMIQDDGPVKSELGDGDIVSSLLLFGVEVKCEELKRPESETNSPLYDCQACQKNFDHEDSLARHNLAVHSLYECQVCLEKFDNEDRLTCHIFAVHSPISCQACKEGFYLEESLTRHIVAVHTPYACQVCQKRFDHEDSLTRHIFAEHSPFACHVCQKTFEHEDSLSRHIFAVHSNREIPLNSYTCGFCCEWFTSTGALIEHLQVHKGEVEENKVRCRFCYKIFSSKYFLKAHMVIHSGDKPYACEVCKKRFKFQNNARAHVKYHTEQSEQYSCGICDKKFTEITDLKKHAMVHKKKYPCDSCNRLFRSSSNLEMHMQVHKKDRPHRPRRKVQTRMP